MTDIVDRLRAAIDADIGIYPAAVAGFHDERDYKQRDGYKNGWNAAIFELDKLHQRLHTDAADELDRLRGLLREARDVIQTAYDEIGGYWYATEKLIPRIDAALSSALGQGVGVGAESQSALNPSEGMARAEVVATPGTPGGGASSIADKLGQEWLE